MKTWAWIIAALVLGWSMCFFTLSSIRKQELKDHASVSEARLRKQNDALRAENASLRNGKTQWIREEVKVGDSSGDSMEPDRILEALVRIHETSFADPKYRQWRIVYHLEQLVQQGEGAIPSIRQFLQRNEDVTFHSGRGSASRERGNPSLYRSRLQFDFPPSLRLGLIEVLARIGGDAAETLLSEVLQVTGRGVEIAMATQVLEEMAPGKYVEEAVAAARELLSEPLKGEGELGVDANTRAYLFRLLSQYDDPAFLEQAKTQLILEDGRLDRQALSYVMEQEGEAALESVYNAFQNTAVLNLSDRLALAQRALEYVGDNDLANEVFNLLMRDAQIPGTLKSAIAEGIAVGNPFVTAQAPESPDEIKTRMQLLETIRIEIQDAKVRSSINKASDQLQTMLDRYTTGNTAQ